MVLQNLNFIKTTFLDGIESYQRPAFSIQSSYNLPQS